MCFAPSELELPELRVERLGVLYRTTVWISR